MTNHAINGSMALVAPAVELAVDEVTAVAIPSCANDSHADAAAASFTFSMLLQVAAVLVATVAVLQYVADLRLRSLPKRLRLLLRTFFLGWRDSVSVLALAPLFGMQKGLSKVLIQNAVLNFLFLMVSIIFMDFAFSRFHREVLGGAEWMLWFIKDVLFYWLWFVWYGVAICVNITHCRYLSHFANAVTRGRSDSQTADTPAEDQESETDKAPPGSFEELIQNIADVMAKIAVGKLLTIQANCIYYVPGLIGSLLAYLQLGVTDGLVPVLCSDVLATSAYIFSYSFKVAFETFCYKMTFENSDVMTCMRRLERRWPYFFGFGITTAMLVTFDPLGLATPAIDLVYPYLILRTFYCEVPSAHGGFPPPYPLFDVLTLPYNFIVQGQSLHQWMTELWQTSLVFVGSYLRRLTVQITERGT